MKTWASYIMEGLSIKYDRRYIINERPDTCPAVVVIDSRQRDNVSKTTPAKYRVSLKKTYNDIVAAELCQFLGYNSNYNITDNENTLFMTLAGEGDTAAPAIVDGAGAPLLTGGDKVSLDNGYYILDDLTVPTPSPNDIVWNLQQTVREYYGLDDNFRIILEKNSGKLLFSYSYPFSFYFNGGTRGGDNYSRRLYREGSMGQLLGFRPKNYQSVLNPAANTYIIESDYPPCMDFDRYVVMNILNMERVDSNNDKVQSAFAIIPLNSQEPDRFTAVSHIHCADEATENIFYFPQPRRVDRLDIEFRDFAGNLYDFRDQEHVFIIKLYSRAFNQKLAY